MCNVSHVMCHVSRVTCQKRFFLLHLFFHLFYLFFIKQSGGDSLWRVCYQRGLPCLVLCIYCFQAFRCETFQFFLSTPDSNAERATSIN